MANVDYISEVWLLAVPLENDYKHTLFFKNSTEQETYFKSRVVRKFTDFNYVRKDNSLRIPSRDANGLDSDYDTLINAGVNYVMFKNTKYDGKTFYSFIKDLRFENKDLTIIDMETDVMQTWFFNHQLKQSFIEREHVTDDTVGAHTLPEGLETGEYICSGYEDYDLGELYIVMATTQKGTEAVEGGVYGGNYSGVGYLCAKLTDYKTINGWLANLAENRASDAVTSIFLLPEFLVPNGEITGNIRANAEDFYTVKYSGIFGDYTPHNNKLFTYPYNYLLASNHNGGSAIYRYEHFNNKYDDSLDEDWCYFKIYGVVCPGGSIKLVPQNYKGLNRDNVDEGLNAGKFPICNWNSDVFTNWLTQNSVNIGLSIASGGMQMISGGAMMMTGGGALAGAGNIASGGMSIAQTLGQIYQQSLTPPQAEGNLNSGDVLTAMGDNKFSLYNMTIKGEYARILDRYFDMFGYKVNQVKIPNTNHRENYWYIKTIDVNIDGRIPAIDMQKIKDCYNNGITFWKDANKIQDYSVSNNII